ncbi:MAG: glycosyltransferase family 92 protein [Clostridia bacterium]|nr:glycosyltransferase family 92 protein [Clostridia bacterium]
MKVAVCAIAKYENNYIREWVQHYITLGFDNVILYDNNDIDGEIFNDVIGDYIRSNYVILKDKRGEMFNQKEFYNECYKEYSNEYDWIAFFDIDEFLELEYDDNIKNYLAKDVFKQFDYIRICWKTYTDNNQIKIIGNNYNCQTRFTEVFDVYDNENNRRQKCIYKTKNNELKLSVHNPINVLNPCNALGIQELKLGTMLPHTLWKGCWLNHYLTKSLEEYISNKCLKHNKLNRKESIYNIYIDRLLDFTSYWEVNEKTTDKLEYINSIVKNDN